MIVRIVENKVLLPATNELVANYKLTTHKLSINMIFDNTTFNYIIYKCHSHSLAVCHACNLSVYGTSVYSVHLCTFELFSFSSFFTYLHVIPIRGRLTITSCYFGALLTLHSPIVMLFSASFIVANHADGRQL